MSKNKDFEKIQKDIEKIKPEKERIKIEKLEKVEHKEKPEKFEHKEIKEGQRASGQLSPLVSRKIVSCGLFSVRRKTYLVSGHSRVCSFAACDLLNWSRPRCCHTV